MALLAALAGAAVARPGAAAAQTCTALDALCDDHPPVVSVSPPGGTFLGDSVVAVHIDWSDDIQLNASSRSITLDGVHKESTFSYSAAAGYSAYSEGTITLRTTRPDTLVATICDNVGQCDWRTLVFTYGGSAVQAYGPATVSAAPQHQGVRVVSPFDVVAGYSTPAYVSQDVSRSVSLVYTSSQALARGFVQVDAYNASTNPPKRFEMIVTDSVTGTLLADTYDSTRVGVQRLGAAWTRSSDATGAKTVSVVVRSIWKVADGAPKDTSVDSPPRYVRVLFLNESGSALGAGWSLAGLQKLMPTTSGVMIANGDGTAAYFSTDVNGAFVSPDGEFSTLTQPGAGASYTRAYPDSSQAVFSSTGRLLSTRDRFGNTTTYGYDAGGNLTTITDPVGKQITLAYSGGHLSTITDPGSRQAQFFFTGSDLTRIADPDGVNALQATYGSLHQMRTLTARNGAVNGFAYDATNAVAADTLPWVMAGGTRTRPVVTIRSWDLALLGGTSTSLTRAVNPDTLHADVTDPRGYRTISRLDRYFEPTFTVGPLGDTTSIQRNEHGQPVTVTNPSGSQTTYQWDHDRLLGTSTTNPQTYADATYDPFANEIAQASYGGETVTNRYGRHGELLRTWTGSDSARATVIVYDTLSGYRVKTVTDPQGHHTDYTYETTGFHNRSTVTAPDAWGTGELTTFTYDAYGRLATTTYPDASTSSVTYDLLNRATRSIDANHDTTSTSIATGDTVSTITDAAHKVYSFTSNTAGWLLSETDPLSRTRSYAYDANGNVTSATDRRAHTVTFAYDGGGRMSSRTADGITTTFSYGPFRAYWEAATNSATADTVWYGMTGNPDSTASRVNGVCFFRKSFWRPEGVRDSLIYASPAGNRKVSYRYDSRVQLNRLTGPGGVSDSTTITYDTDGLATSIRMPSGLVESASYDANHALASSSWSASAVNGTFYRDWFYDRLGNVATRSDGGNIHRAYGYDAIGQLTWKADSSYVGEQHVCDDPFDLTTCYVVQVWQEDSAATYSYDRVGNRTDNGAALNTLSNAYSSFGGYTLAYDSEGNLTSKTKTGYSQTYTWNDLGQLASVTTNGTTVSYVYNGFGQRVKRTQGSTVTLSAYDGDDLLLETDGSGNVLREYTMFPGIDQPLSLRTWSGTTPGSANYYVLEQPGHVVGLATSSNTVANEYHYTPWGQPESTSETVSQPLRFMAREYDSTTGLYYVRSRWYDPTLARFSSEDPLGLDGGINPYAFVENSPTNDLDPYGLDPELGGCIASAMLQMHMSQTMAEAWCNVAPFVLQGIVAIAGGPWTPKDRGGAGLAGNPQRGKSPGCCGDAPPMPNTAPNPYPPEYRYMHVSGRLMFCETKNDPWSQAVRGCLACELAHGTAPDPAHHECYAAGFRRTDRLQGIIGFTNAVMTAGAIWTGTAIHNVFTTFGEMATSHGRLAGAHAGWPIG